MLWADRDIPSACPSVQTMGRQRRFAERSPGRTPLPGVLEVLPMVATDSEISFR